MAASGGERERNVYFVRQKNLDTEQYIREKTRPLFRAPVFYDAEGFIYYFTYRNITDQGLLEPKFVQISKLHPQANIYAPYTTYPGKKELRPNRIAGGVEDAIQSVEHILEGTKGKETDQAQTVKTRAGELLGRFAERNFSEITTEELEDYRQETYRLLQRQKFNPAMVIQEHKRRMGDWLVKGSFGHDTKGRRNKLISTMALVAAHRTAIVRQQGLGDIASKFAEILEALCFEREFDRTIFSDVMEKLRPDALPAHRLFKFPGAKADNTGIVIGILNTMRYQLEQPRVRYYKPIARQAEVLLTQAVDLLREDRRGDIVEADLFSQAYLLLQGGFEKHKVTPLSSTSQ